MVTVIKQVHHKIADLNFLAHLRLSHDDDNLAIGNMIADFISNNEVDHYQIAIQRGILLHRFIDSYTDHHSLVRRGTKRLREEHGKYAPVVIDILYDHLLAKNWLLFSSEPLEDFAQRQYQLLEKNMEMMPRRLKKALPEMIEGDWLVQYGHEKGLRYTLKKMDERTKFPSNFVGAVEDLKDDFVALEQEFCLFFSEMLLETKIEVIRNLSVLK